ncbi:hypothetical protein [Natrinema halophilum]|uniref:Uncharacterized protein n=1 Tax=Natrinema halophilum TaxID=1699371 RepID=A0A7D5GMU1_9EURY|nr:hypothetical protein [Natrinema halophilum]QLG50890.1 hypothetical protein HYG82_19640 [Natrinema halophilum]
MADFIHLILLILVTIGMVGIPTVGMYREASEHSTRPDEWTSVMFVLSIAFPAIGPILLWILYTAVHTRG